MSNGIPWKGTLPKGDAKIWRYMDFARFISLLDKEALFFSRADKLGDPFEGSFPKTNIRKRPSTLGSSRPEDLEAFSKFYRLHVKLTVVNCWHLNDFESDAMWKLYLKSGEGIAVQSTVGRLRSSLKKHKQDVVYQYKVEYEDYEKVRIPEGTLSPYFHKRKSFEHEKEYRAVIQRVSQNKKTGELNFDKTPFPDGGIYIPVDLDILVERIHLSPTCPNWQNEILESLTKIYGLNRNIRQSKLIEKPEY